VLDYEAIFCQFTQTYFTGHERSKTDKTLMAHTLERNTRHDCLGKQAHHCKAQRITKGRLRRFRRIRLKAIYLTEGGLTSNRRTEHYNVSNAARSITQPTINETGQTK
jgi:hypothetical protein